MKHRLFGAFCADVKILLVLDITVENFVCRAFFKPIWLGPYADDKTAIEEAAIRLYDKPLVYRDFIITELFD